MQIINSVLTQGSYTDALTIAPFGYESISVSVSGSSCVMQPMDKTGALLDEITLPSGAYTLTDYGGVRFKTDPISAIPATIFAAGYRKGEPSIAGLQPRNNVPAIVLNIDNSIVPAGGGSTTISSPRLYSPSMQLSWFLATNGAAVGPDLIVMEVRQTIVATGVVVARFYRKVLPAFTAGGSPGVNNGYEETVSFPMSLPPSGNRNEFFVVNGFGGIVNVWATFIALQGP